MMPEETVWYFAYGSNLDIFQMLKRVGEWKTSRRACFEGWKLIFDKESKRWGGCTANIHRTDNPSDLVYGAVYEIRRSKLDVLSGYEGTEPSIVDAKLEDGSPLPNAHYFSFPPSKKSGAVPAVYKNAILDGLRQHGYGGDVIKKTESAMPQS